MIFKPLRRSQVPDSPGIELIEPSAGTATAFIVKMNEFPKEKGADGKEQIIGRHYTGFRALICLHQNGKPYLTELVNELNKTTPAQWPLSVPEDSTTRQTIEFLDNAYLVRVVDFFIDSISLTQFESVNDIIRKEIWIDKEPSKND